ncbi:MAG: DUF2905 domain-containing protein [Acidobacteriia bacterium]|nr:DUF2905 domain-containing protein [Methyloceanibacter sp.]MBX5472835.1 DUF2905 domain-containing protein [Acetobacteraceae bacterium]MCL6491674.1 DUF2905 domain-containing protein [Terriglobia bacterium]
MQRFLIGLGLLFIVMGIIWPWLARLGLGRLPGDIRIERPNFVFFFPLGTSLLISLVLTLILSLIVWLLRK